MAISFDQLPDKNPGIALIEPGKYTAIIKTAEMKTSAAGNDYMNIGLEVYDAQQKKIGFVYDILTESDKPIAQFKLKRFIIANNLENELSTMSFELKDLCKLVVNKTVVVDVKTEKGKNGYSDKTIVDAFSDDIYAAAEQIETTAEDTQNETDLNDPF